MTNRFCGGKYSEPFCRGDGVPDGNIEYKGIINEASDYPAPDVVQIGWTYTIGYKEVISSLTSTGGTATANVSSIFYNNFINSSNIIVADADQSEYNGVFVGTKGSPNQITYPIFGTPTSPATGNPTIASPETVTDSDPTKTYTQQTFTNSDEIKWAGSSWVILGPDRIWQDDGLKVKTLNPRDIDFQNKNGINVADPINDKDAANKRFITANQSNIYYFGKNGNDAEDGKSLQTRRLTANAAIALANAHTPAPTGKNRVMIKCTDGASYNKFNLSGGPGFITMDAEETGFNVLITSGSPDGIKIDSAYQADLGYIINDDASDDAGSLLEFLPGASLQGANIRQIFNGGSIKHTLIKSSGGKVFVNCDELRQSTDRTALAIDVANGFFRLERNKFLRGSISLAASTTADLSMFYTDGDITIGDNSRLVVTSFIDKWIGDITIGNNCFVKIEGGTWDGQILSQGSGGTIILNFNEQI
jgi:hypothetical protein